MQLLLCLTLFVPSQDSGKRLRDAAEKGEIATVRELIAENVDVDSPNDYGRTSLSIAAGLGHVEVVKLLLEAGADVESKDRFYKFTPLLVAVNSKRPVVVKVLLDAGAKGVGRALSFAAFGDDVELLKAVLSSKNITPAQLRTALAGAKSAKKPENVAILEPLVEKLGPEPKNEATKKAKKAEMPAKQPVKLSAEQLKQYEGLYIDARGMEVAIKAGDNSIVMTITASNQKMTLAATAKDEFELSGGAGSSLKATFVREADKVTSLKWVAGTNEFNLRREVAPDTSIEKPAWEEYALDGSNWPAFRGPMSRGIMKGQNLPTEWDAESGRNIAWKTPVAGLGLSCPVVWGDSVFVSTAVPVDEEKPTGSQLKIGLYGDVGSVADDREYRFKLACLSLSTGDVLWERECNKAKPRVKRHAKSSHANPTPVTNGEYVVASFSSEGIYCFDTSGELVWKKDLGFLDSGWFFDRTFQWGFAASPYIFEGTVYLQCDIQDQSFLVALDLQTGDEKWRTDRNDIPTWSSPVAYRDPAGNLRVAVNGTREAAAYDGQDGKRIWGLSGMSEIVVPTPQVTPNYLLLASGYAPIRPIIAMKHTAGGEFEVKESAKGKAAEDKQKDPKQEASEADESKGSEATSPSPFAWKLENGGSYLPTPLIYDGFVHVVSNSGVLSCFDATTGKRLSRVRLSGAGSCTGSPVLADGVLYITSESGKTFVVPAGPNEKPVKKNEIGEAVLSTPAIAGGRLLIRAENHLFAIGKLGPPDADR